MANPGTLFVFFHGLCAGRETGGELEVVLPNVPGHIFKAGAWLAEAAIATGAVLRLNGVATSGSARFSQLQNKAAIDLPDCWLTSRARSATLRLPLPKSILGFLRATPPTTPFPVPPAVPPLGRFVAWREDTLAGWESIATVVILTYDYPDEAGVVLDGHRNWEPSATGGAMSLHIISTSEGPEGEEHERETQDVLRKVIGGYPGMKFAKPAARPDWRDTGNLNFGDLTALKPQGDLIVTRQGGNLAFAQAELEDIRPRTTRLMRLGRLKQENQPIESVWNTPDLLGEELPNCLFYTTK